MGNAFFGFSPKSFEQFIEAVAIHTMGPGVVLFGSGPDGGREATFQGNIPFPFPDTDTWDGYGVVQAKYKEKTEGTAKDQKWALKLIEEELEKFVTSDKREQLPEYFLFATNVVLTPAPRSGGRDKANKIIKSYYKKLPLRGHFIWDSDELHAYLNAYEALRSRFWAHFTTGDVLYKLAAAIESNTPDFTSIATSFLDRQLRAERDAKLDQAGQRTDERTPLAKVFIDLPASPTPTQDPPQEEVKEDKPPPGFLKALIDIGEMALDPASLLYHRSHILSTEKTKELASRFVLIGGPGSGKSTLGQYLAQIHRAALLRRRKKHTLLPESQTIIDDLFAQCEADAIPWPATPRYPFRIDLSDFAIELASSDQEAPRTLLAYLTHKMGGDRRIAVEDLLAWLERYPWLLVLDGLDEVPASSNREEVCTAIQNFLSEATSVNADLLVLATTRPQGYNGEFGTETYQYQYLPPLSIARALAYVKRFSSARFGDSSPRVSEIVDTMRSAAQGELTARLMRSPLQVTFMATLVAAGGRPPRDRWKLFNDYYDTIYKREQQKAEGDLRIILGDHDTLIHRVHHEVGYLLQVQSEAAGGTDAMMPHDQFERRVDAHLAEEGWEDPEKADIRDQIMDAATTRLVFLTSRVATKITFEVRSLQEYVASERLTSGLPESVLERLRIIAPISLWRNVFLFAAGKCFAAPDLSHLRSEIRDICEALNQNDENRLAKTMLAGSQLALALLEDGTVANSPKFAHMFARLALDLLDLSPELRLPGDASSEAWYIRLSRVYDPRLEEVYREAIETRLNRRDVTQTLGGWALLVEFIDQDTAWSNTLAEQYWPNSHEDQWQIAQTLLNAGNWRSWLISRLPEIVPHISPIVIRRTLNWEIGIQEPSWLNEAFSTLALHDSFSSVSIDIVMEGFPEREIQLVLTSLRPTHTSFSLLDMPSCSEAWSPYLLSERFRQNPSREALADTLHQLSNYPSLVDLKNMDKYLPWPLAMCIGHASSIEDLSTMAKYCEQGKLGDSPDWVAAEKRWQEKGVTLEDLQAFVGLDVPFDSEIATCGYPNSIETSSWEYVHGNEMEKSILLWKTIEHCHDKNTRQFLSVFLNLSLMVCAGIGEYVPLISPSRAHWLLPHPKAFFGLSAFAAFEWPDTLDSEWIAFFDWLGRNRENIWTRGETEKIKTILPEQLAGAFVTDPSLVGVLRLLSLFASMGYDISVPKRLLKHDRYEESIYQFSALLLALCHSPLDTAEVNALVKLAVALQKDAPLLGAMQHTLSALNQQRIDVSLREQVLLCLRGQLGSELHEFLKECDALLMGLLQGRESGLGVRARAEALHLPYVEASTAASA